MDFTKDNTLMSPYVPNAPYAPYASWATAGDAEVRAELHRAITEDINVCYTTISILLESESMKKLLTSSGWAVRRESLGRNT